jgi:hypothetical protein
MAIPVGREPEIILNTTTGATGIAGPIKLDPATSWMLIGLPSIHGAKLLAVDHAIVIDIF